MSMNSSDPTHNQAIHYTITNLVMLLRAKKMPFAIVVQDCISGIVQSHSYTPIDSSIAIHNQTEITIRDERQAS
jgi:hypothetical protein